MLNQNPVDLRALHVLLRVDKSRLSQNTTLEVTTDEEFSDQNGAFPFVSNRNQMHRHIFNYFTETNINSVAFVADTQLTDCPGCEQGESRSTSEEDRTT